MVDQVMAGHRDHFGICAAADTAGCFCAVCRTACGGRDFLSESMCLRRKLRIINSFPCNRRRGGIPAAERVVAGIVISLDRCLPVVFRHRAVFQDVGSENGPVAVVPGHRVGPGRCRIYRGVGRVGCRCDRLRRPAGEGVGILGVVRTDRRPVINRNSVFTRVRCSEDGSVIVLPGDRICDGTLLPDRVQGRVSLQVDRCPVRIGCCFVVRVGAPSKEDVSGAGIGIRCEDTVRTLGYHLRVHGSLAAVGDEGQGDRIFEPHIEHCGITEQIPADRIGRGGIFIFSARSV